MAQERVWEIRRVRPEEGPLLRAARIAALSDTPIAFGVTLAETLARTPEEWTERAIKVASSNRDAMFLALADEDPVGIMGAYFESDDNCWVLISVWVHADYRGGVLARALHMAVTDWVRSTGAQEIFLNVGVTNARAQAFYHSLGYQPTGRSTPHPWHPTEVELDLRLPLV